LAAGEGVAHTPGSKGYPARVAKKGRKGVITRRRWGEKHRGTLRKMLHKGGSEVGRNTRIFAPNSEEGKRETRMRRGRTYRMKRVSLGEPNLSMPTIQRGW